MSELTLYDIISGLEEHSLDVAFPAEIREESRVQPIGAPDPDFDGPAIPRYPDPKLDPHDEMEQDFLTP